MEHGTLGLCLLLAAAAPPTAPAQDSVPAGPAARGPVGDAWQTLGDSGRALWLRPVASAAVPGTGQLLGRQDRGAIYLVAEAFFVTRVLTIRGQGRREREQFLDLAFTVARGPFMPTARDTAFEYFEQMGKFIESGPFDTDPGPSLVPPLDEATYNGAVWALARRTFFPDPDESPAPDSPEYQAALGFYRDRAVGPNFRWSWRNAGLEQDLYRQSIRESDEAFRRVTQQLGLVLANHLISAIDAFITERLGQPDGPVTVTSGLWLPGVERRLHGGLALSLRF